MILNRLNQLIKLSNRSFATNTDFIKSILGKKIIEHQKSVAKLRNEYGDKVIDRITVEQLFDGMRNVRTLVTETSFIDPHNGIYFRGYPIKECCKQVSKRSNTNQPLPEGLFYLLLTGDLPTEDQVKTISKFWAEHSEIPSHVVKMINNFPSNLQPMSQLSCAVNACSTQSLFTKAYSNGVPKAIYWEYIYEDSMRIIAKLPTIAALIYRNLYRDNSSIGAIDLNKDWSYNFISMLNIENKDLTDYMRLFLTIHSDEEGNVGTHATHLVNSTLSNPYQAYSAAINGLAGPLNGANQMVLNFITNLANEFNSCEIEDHKLKEYILTQLNNQNDQIPGFGHDILLKTDPRYVILYEFALKYLPDYPILKLVSQLNKIVPEIFLEKGSIKNSNVDLLSGLLLKYYGIKETNFYPVLIGISRSLGALSTIIWDRGLNKRLINPDSFTINGLFKIFQIN